MTEGKIYRDFEDRAELYGTIKHLFHEYSPWHYDVTVLSRFNNGRIHRRTVDPDELSYEPEENRLDIYGVPATGRFPQPDNVVGIEVERKEE